MPFTGISYSWGSDFMWPPQLVKAIAGHFPTSPGAPFPFWYAKADPQKSRWKSPVLPARIPSSVWIYSEFSQHRKPPAFTLSWKPPTQAGPTALRVLSDGTIMNHASVRNIISSWGEELYVRNRISIKHTLMQEEKGCLADKNYVTTYKAFLHNIISVQININI